MFGELQQIQKYYTNDKYLVMLFAKSLDFMNDINFIEVPL